MEILIFQIYHGNFNFTDLIWNFYFFTKKSGFQPSLVKSRQFEPILHHYYRQFQKDNSRQFLTILDNSRPIQTFLDNSRPFQTILEHSRPFQTILDHSRPFQTIPDYSRLFYFILDNSRQFQTILDNSRQNNHYNSFAV